jgi:hypothetical protein
MFHKILSIQFVYEITRPKLHKISYKWHKNLTEENNKQIISLAKIDKLICN